MYHMTTLPVEVRKKMMTLVVVCDGERLLLGMKKRGFSEGRWNGFGGKVDNTETIEEAAKRELQEESGLVANELHKAGMLSFSFKENITETLEVHVFKVTAYSGEPQETEEMKPEWFSLDAVPFSQMWSDDEYWFPFFIDDRLFKGKFLFDRPANAEYASTILQKEVVTVDYL
jgi:8-oxo-dGTP diphosphatase / 2-hydroxy-dATP diphosphatase